jgi:hypothetical protein
MSSIFQIRTRKKHIMSPKYVQEKLSYFLTFIDASQCNRDCLFIRKEREEMATNRTITDVSAYSINFKGNTLELFFLVTKQNFENINRIQHFIDVTRFALIS